jgi:hypothetical protein
LNRYFSTNVRGKRNQVAYSHWYPASEIFRKADQARLTRYGKHAYVIFEKPQEMKLFPEVNAKDFGNASVRNLMIHALDDDGSPKTLAYCLASKP